MTKADQLVDKAAARLQELADKAAAEGGVTRSSRSRWPTTPTSSAS